MTPVKKKPRYFVIKQLKNRQIYYWQPASSLQKFGFRTRRLSDALEDAQSQAETYNKELDEFRKKKNQKPSMSAEPSLKEVIDLYKKSTGFNLKAVATQRIYTQCLDRLERWAGDIPIAEIPRRSILEFHEALYQQKPAFANAIGRMISIVFKFAYDKGIITANIARELKLPKQAPRQTIWTIDEQEAFLRSATQAGYQSMVLAVLLGVSTAQREGDILSLTWHQYDGVAIRLRQRKTKRWVSVPALPELKSALDKAKIANQAKAQEERCEYIVVCEGTKTKYRDDYFRHLFRKIANLAGLNHLQFRDLRRSAVVRFAEAGLSTARITAISGHDVGHCENILEVYMPRTSEMAEEAIRQFEEFRARQKIK